MNSGVTESLISPSSYIEKHTLSGMLTEDVLHFAIGKNVTINVEEQPARERDSTRAKSKMLSEYKSDKRENFGTSAGRILAVRGKLLAYLLFSENIGEAVRVMEFESQNRQLIKDFRQPIVDLQWATHIPLLAVLDANANLYIYSVEEKGQKINKYLNIIQEGDHISTEPGRLVWCPYIPDETDDPDIEREDVHMLGVLQGSKVNVFQLHKIKRFIGRSEVSYSRVKEVPGGLLSVELDSKISTCRISPDATALAVATFDGFLSFFVVEEDAVQLASRIKPLNNNHIEELIFLDNLFLNTQEQFWKYVTLVSDNGRRLAIFDCDSWDCLAKLRFECPNQVGRMDVLVEPSSHFLFLVDYDMANLFCIELSNGHQSCAPICFASCTLITFANQFINIVPCLLNEPVSDSGGDLLLDEDEGLGGGNGGGISQGISVVASLVAINNKAVFEVTLELDRFFNVDPSLAVTAVPQTAQLGRSRHQSQQNLEQPLSEEHQPKQQNAIGPPKEITMKKTQTHNASSVVFMPEANGASVDQKLTDLMEQKFGALNEKLEELSFQLIQMHKENENLRSAQNDNLSNALEKISNELKLREERIEATVRKAGKESAEKMLRTSEQQLTSCGVQMQRTLDLAQTRLAEQLHGSVERTVVPQVEVLCTQLFQQLNDTFRNGLQEFMDQLRAINQQQSTMLTAVQAQAAVVAAALGANESMGGTGAVSSAVVGGTQHQSQHPPPIDEVALARFIDGNQTRLAFELVINKGDQTLLNYVCSKVDPDDYFEVSVSNPSVPLPIPLLLALLRMLSTKLDSETVLRFRYIENVLLSLNSKHSLLTMDEFQKMVLDEQQFRWTLEQLYKSLNAFDDGEMNPTLKRQLRISNQLIMNLLRTA